MQVTLIEGNVGRDPEIRATSNGKSVANFTVATTEKYKDTEKTEWHNIVAFGYSADVVREHVKKGTRVFIRGKNQTRKWEDKHGQTKYTTEIVASTIAPIPRAASNETQEVTGLNTDAAPITDAEVPF